MRGPLCRQFTSRPVGWAKVLCAERGYGMDGDASLRLRTLRLLDLGAQALGGVERRNHDILVAGAATQVARDGDANLLFGRVWIVAQEFQQRGQDAGRAEATLQAVVLVERLLQRMQLLGARRDAFDGEKVVAVRLHGEHQARARGTAIHQDRAGAADAVLAADMGTGKAELMADEIRERDADLDFLFVALTVDRQCDLAGLAHTGPQSSFRSSSQSWPWQART